MPILDNPRHEAFAQALAEGKTADEAYVLAGYKANRGNATVLKAKQSVKARVRELLAKGERRAEVTVAQVLTELSRLAMSDLRKGFDADGRLLPPTEWSDEFSAAVASIEVVTKSLPGEADDEMDAQPHGGALARRRNAKVEYVHKIKFWDKNSALEKIAKYLGMFVDRHEVTGREGAPIESVTTHRLDPSSAAIIEKLVK